jgi:hypothetical protein
LHWPAAARNQGCRCRGLQGEFQRLLVKRKIDGGLAVHVRTVLADIMGLRGAGSQQQEKSSRTLHGETPIVTM